MDDLSTADPRTLLSLLLLLGGTLLAVHALRSRRWEVVAAALTAAGLASWTLTNRPYEGAVLLTPFEGNGLTAADLLCVPGAVALALLCWRSVRR